jgi:hypothetical protein
MPTLGVVPDERSHPARLPAAASGCCLASRLEHGVSCPFPTPARPPLFVPAAGIPPAQAASKGRGGPAHVEPAPNARGGHARWVRLAALAGCLVAAPAAGAPLGVPGAPQPGAPARRATTVSALVAYPVFFHGHPVRVRGHLRPSGAWHVLVEGDAELLVAAPSDGRHALDTTEQVEIAGTFLDLGRAQPNDPRVLRVDAEAIARERTGKPWPGAGELPLLIVDRVDPALPFAAPSVRALALDPDRYIGARVTVTGRFRGRNLYGDQPDAPGRSRWDFVLQVADASVWVVGRRPRGEGFNLDVEARVDTNRWLEVAGIVRRERGLVLVEAAAIRLAAPPADSTPAEPVARVPAVGPPPEVVFSVPTQDESDVARDTRIRIQFSRDLDPKTLAGRVHVAYLEVEATERGEAQPPAIEFNTHYDEGARVLEIRFPRPLERFRTLKVTLDDGIAATDGARLVPWTLTFTLGGS